MGKTPVHLSSVPRRSWERSLKRGLLCSVTWPADDPWTPCGLSSQAQPYSGETAGATVTAHGDRCLVAEGQEVEEHSEGRLAQLGGQGKRGGSRSEPGRHGRLETAHVAIAQGGRW